MTATIPDLALRKDQISKLVDYGCTVIQTRRETEELPARYTLCCPERAQIEERGAGRLAIVFSEPGSFLLTVEILLSVPGGRAGQITRKTIGEYVYVNNRLSKEMRKQ